MSKENLEKLKDVYKVWLNESESWNRYAKTHHVNGHDIEEVESVTILSSNTAAYIWEKIRQIIEDETKEER